jgi:hypothetical protein
VPVEIVSGSLSRESKVQSPESWIKKKNDLEAIKNLKLNRTYAFAVIRDCNQYHEHIFMPNLTSLVAVPKLTFLKCVSHVKNVKRENQPKELTGSEANF